MHPDLAYLRAIVPKLAHFLQTRLQLTLHPKKMYLQHYSKGVPFLGTIIKPHRIYIADRTKGNFYAAIRRQNAVVEAGRPDKIARAYFLGSMNSYLGLLKHYQTYRLRRQMLAKNLSPWWLRCVRLNKSGHKFILKSKK